MLFGSPNDDAISASFVAASLVRAGFPEHYHFGSLFTTSALRQVSNPVVTTGPISMGAGK